MKKVVVLVVLLAAAIWWWPSSSKCELEPSAAPVTAIPQVTQIESGDASEKVAAPLVAEERKSVEAAVVAPAAIAAAVDTQCSITVYARWDDGTPAVGELAMVTTSMARLDESIALLTDSTGSAVFSGLPPLGAHVRLLRGTHENLVLRPGKMHEVALTIDAGVDLEGRVLDSNGRAVAGASIWLSERYRNNIGHGIAATNDRGEFFVRSIRSDHFVGALARGFAPSGLRPVRGAPGDKLRLDFMLEAVAAPLTLQVVDALGEPIAGARVLVGVESPQSVRMQDGTFAPSAPPQRAATDAQGRASFESAALGPCEVQARAEGFSPALTNVDVVAGVSNLCRIELSAQASLVGRAVDSAGKPVAGARVSVGESDHFASSWTFTRREGAFELDGIAAGRQLARIESREAGAATREFLFNAGSALEWSAVLTQAPRIEGQVLHADGTPAAGLVLIAFASGKRGGPLSSANIDDQGHFELPGLQAQSHDLWVQSPKGWAEFPLLEVLDVWPGGAPLLLRLPHSRESCRIVLQVDDANGNALAGTELQTWHAESRTWRSFVSAGEHGEIDVENVPAGTLALELRHPEHPWKRLGEHKLAPGETLDLGRIALDAAGSLSVQLRGIPAEDCSRLEAVITGSDHRESAAARLSPGQLTANALSAGKHRLRVGGEGIQQVQREFEISAGARTELSIELQPASGRELQFRWPEGTAGPKWISLSLLDAQGALAFGGNADCTQDPPSARVWAKPGNYRMWAGGEGDLRANVELIVPPIGEESTPLVISLTKQP